MALKIIILALIVGFILLLTLDSLPGNEDLQTCASQMSANYYTIQDFSRERRWSTQRTCQTAAQQIYADQQCIESVFKNRITARFIFWISQHRPAINNTIRRHNSFCIDYQIPVYEINVIEQNQN